MIGYVLKRVVRGVATVLGVLTVAFFILRLNGKPAVAMIPDAGPQAIAELNRRLGYDGSLALQYGRFMAHAVRGDLGQSLNQPGVSTLYIVLDHLAATLELAVSSLLLGLVVGFLLAFLITVTDSPALRSTLIWLGVARQATPTFLFGVLLVIVFGVKLAWLPTIGSGGISHLILPTLTLGTFEITLYMRLLDSALAGQRDLDYVRTARAKGQRGSLVITRHMLPNALIPTLTVAGVNFGQMLGGVVVVEAVFAWPGVGELIVQSVAQRDYPVVQTALLVVAVLFVAVNLLVDLLYAVLDPRVRTR